MPPIVNYRYSTVLDFRVKYISTIIYNFGSKVNLKSAIILLMQELTFQVGVNEMSSLHSLIPCICITTCLHQSHGYSIFGWSTISHSLLGDFHTHVYSTYELRFYENYTCK